MTDPRQPGGHRHGPRPPRSRRPRRPSVAPSSLWDVRLPFVPGTLSLLRAHRLNWDVRPCLAWATERSGVGVCAYLCLPSDAHLLVRCGDFPDVVRFVPLFRDAVERDLQPVPGVSRLWSDDQAGFRIDDGERAQLAALRALLGRAIHLGWVGAGRPPLPGLPGAAGAAGAP